MTEPTRPMLRYSLPQAMAQATKQPAKPPAKYSLAEAMRRMTAKEPGRD